MIELLRMIIGKPHAAGNRPDEAGARMLSQERGNFRQSLQRISSGSSVMMRSWEGVGQMMKDADDAQ